jgi:hypothetical protein
MISCVHIKNSDITLPISKKETNIFRLMSCIANSSGSCDAIEHFQDCINNLTKYSSLVDFMNIKEKLKEINTLTKEIHIIISEDRLEIEYITKDNIKRVIEQIKNIYTTTEKATSIYAEKATSIIIKLEIILRDLDYFINYIIELNDVIKNTDVQDFFINLETNSKPPEEDTIMDETNDEDDFCGIHQNKTSNVTVDKPNIYFLCEYIIRNLNYKLLSEQPNMEVGNAEGGETKKSSKFKITKKQNKNKNNKKRTRKYLR